MLTLRLAIASLLATPIAAFADGFSPVTQREIFVELVNARESFERVIEGEKIPTFLV